MCGAGTGTDDIDALEAWVDALDVDAIAADVATLVRYRTVAERLAAKLQIAAHRLDRSGVWAQDGSTSATAALIHHGRAHRGEAARSLRTGRLCDRVPELGDRALDGRLSAGQVRVIVANVPPWANRSSPTTPPGC